MAFGFFTVPIQDSGRSQEEWNAFLRRHKILSVDRRRMEQGASSFWRFCIDTLEGAPADASGYRAADICTFRLWARSNRTGARKEAS